jgi:alanine racemase
VGYGSSFTAPEAMPLGVAAGGYADGLLRAGGTGTPVIVAGVRTQIVGRVSMDMVTVDLRPLIDQGLTPAPGLPVTFWGQDPSGAVLPIDEVAQASGTIAYELMCGLTPRVPKHPVN